uniref:Transmembrane protein n=1 Tax=Quercus lobata TaxID=97700 RepID=A0A7N2N1B2_QUELO
MVQLMRALSTAFILSLLLLLSFITLSNSSATEVGAVDHLHHVKGTPSSWQGKLWMNHGSFRGPRKHLVNPTVQHPFQARDFPV